MARPIIEVRNLGKSYRLGAIGMTSLRDELDRAWQCVRGRGDGNGKSEEFWALRDVSFDIEPGEVIGIIGRNGAGKSTLLKILSRITQPSSGRVTLRGRVASLLEVGTGFHPDLTGAENIFLNGAILGMTKAEVRRNFAAIVAFAEIDQFIDTPVKRYSTGMYVRLAFAVAAHLEPEILIVDEVLAVGDAAFQKKCLRKMDDVASRDGRTVLFVSHNLLAVQTLCHRCLLLADGQLRVDGDAASVVSGYLSANANATHGALDQRRDRSGTGLVRFTELRLLAADGAPVNNVRSGDSAVFMLIFENHANRDLDGVVIGVGIDDPMGQRITALTTDAWNATPLVIPRGCTAVQILIERVPLLPARYGITLYFAVSGEVADWIQSAAYFDVETGDYFGTGRLPYGQGHFLVDYGFRIMPVESESGGAHESSPEKTLAVPGRPVQ